MNTPSENNEQYQNWLESQDKVECFNCGHAVEQNQKKEMFPTCPFCFEKLISEEKLNEKASEAMSNKWGMTHPSY